jgi:hypothetical protein
VDAGQPAREDAGRVGRRAAVSHEDHGGHDSDTTERAGTSLSA